MPRSNATVRLVAVLTLAALVCVVAMAPAAPATVELLISELLLPPTAQPTGVPRPANDRLEARPPVQSPHGLRAPPAALVSTENERYESGGTGWLDEVGLRRC